MESRKRTIENSKSCTKLEMKVATYAFKMLSLVCTHTPSDMAWVLFKNVPIFKDKMDVLSI